MRNTSLLYTGPVIVVKGHDNYQVVFLPEVTSGSFMVHVYTTSPLTSFTLQRSDGIIPSEQIVTEPVSYSPYGIIAEYKVSLPWLEDKTTGVYTVSVTNEDNESADQNINILKAKGNHFMLK